ncbi:MAG: hypothetical protein LBC85_09625 [Fibromonadaceae bacterium]|jgi:hypothetical protein|nr:hypothetical protein [Fibromonadaceae bacterium]
MAKKLKIEINKDMHPTKEEVNMFDIIFPLIQSDLEEIRELSKKKQDEPLNKFKIKIINKKLEKAKLLLRNEPTIEFLDLLDEETLPTNSDAVLQITQFIKAMSSFKKKYYLKKGNFEFDIGAGYSEWETKD